MSDLPDIPISRDRLRGLARDEWDRFVAADPQEPNLEMLAAYVDGGLDDAGREYVARHIAQSPRAWAVLESMLAPGQKLPFIEERTEGPARRGPPGIVRPAPVPGHRERVFYYPLAMAAGLLLAVTFGGMSWHFSRQRDELAGQVAKLEQAEVDRRETRVQLARLEKMELTEAAAEFRPQVHLGSTDTRHTFDSLRRAVSGGVRGANDGERTRLDEAAAAARDAIERAAVLQPAQSLAWRLDEAAVLIAALKFDEADRLLAELEKSHPDDPRVKNARGAWLVHRASQLPAAESEPLLARAEPLLKSAAAGEPQAWLNLFVLYSARQDKAAAAAAVREYAKTSGDVTLRDFVKEQFGP
jgi:hypothetical protein